MENSYYKTGLPFQCARCSSCCRFEPGYVFLSHFDLDRLLEATMLSRAEFVETYCRTVEIGGFKRLSLTEKSDYDCVFWEKSGCKVYEHRPLQCRSYPFWPAYLSSPESWEDLKRSCPGVGIGKLHSFEEIEYWLKRREAEPFIFLD